MGTALLIEISISRIIPPSPLVPGAPRLTKGSSSFPPGDRRTRLQAVSVFPPPLIWRLRADNAFHHYYILGYQSIWDYPCAFIIKVHAIRSKLSAVLVDHLGGTHEPPSE